MALTKEEIAAELVWRYVEHVRESEGAGHAAALSRAELQQLAGVLETASQVPPALESAGSERCRAAVRTRVEQLLGEGTSASPERPASAPRRTGRLERLTGGAARVPVPAWALRSAMAAAAALTLALGTVNLWHQPARVVRVAFPKDVTDVEPMDEQQAHKLIPEMVHNQLSPREEKNLMGHMLVCPGCFDQYVEMRHHAGTARQPRREAVWLVSR
jgi:hypothetical protein